MIYDFQILKSKFDETNGNKCFESLPRITKRICEFDETNGNTCLP
jgi:hypothetical protein